MHNYIDEIISNFNNYHKDGFLIRSFDKDLNISDSEKVIEDYGDIIPYLYYFDGKDFSNQILNNILNSNYVKDGVYIKNKEDPSLIEALNISITLLIIIVFLFTTKTE